MDEEEKKKVFRRAKDQITRFYDEEHHLDEDQRKQLYVFFEQQFRRMMLLSSVGFTAGVALPFVLRKKGKLLNPGLPIFGGIIGSALLPSLFNQTVFEHQLKGVVNDYGTESPIYKTIMVTPEPVTKSFFWSSYFQRSSEDPGLRMRDPREVSDDNVLLVLNRSKDANDIDPSKPGSVLDSVPRYGRPDYGERETAYGAWDKVRSSQQPQLSTAAASNAKGDDDVYQLSPSTSTDDDPFADSFGTKEIKTIGDSYEKDVKVKSWDSIRKDNSR